MLVMPRKVQSTDWMWRFGILSEDIAWPCQKKNTFRNIPTTIDVRSKVLSLFGPLHVFGHAQQLEVSGFEADQNL